MLGRAWVRVLPIVTLVSLAPQSVLNPSSQNFNISSERFTRIGVAPFDLFSSNCCTDALSYRARRRRLKAVVR